MRNKKYLSACILVLLLLLIPAGCGCSIETVNEHNAKIEQEALERSSVLEELINQTPADETSTTAPNHSTDTSNLQTDTTVNENTDISASYSNTATDSQSEALTTDASTGAASAKATAPAPNETSVTQTSDNAAISSDKPATEQCQTTAPQSQTTAPYIMVHITITCSRVIDNPDLSTDTELPEDGIMLDTYVAVKNGDSVFTALKAAADDNDISLSYTGSRGSVYLSGINGLYEKQCGRYSGWKYSVNNVYPNVGCGGYTLSDGDSILFGYVATYTDTY